MPSKPRQRELAEITADNLADAIRELRELIEPKFPQRVYRSEGYWPMAAIGLVAQMLSTAQSIASLSAAGSHNDVLVLLRLLYEQVVTFCWLAIDPDRHLADWANEGHLQRLRLHNDALAFGHQILTKDEVEEIKTRIGMPKLIERADEIDRYWPGLISGFRANPSEGPKQILTMRGLYVGLYRTTSRAAHANVASVDAFVDQSRYPRYPAVVQLNSAAHSLAPMAVPLVALALLVCNHRLRWPDAEIVKQLNAALLHDVDASPALDTKAL